MMNSKNIARLIKLSLFIFITKGMTLSAAAEECQLTHRVDPVNLTVPVTAQMPANAVSASTGTVLYKKEASLAQLTGVHKTLTGACYKKISQSLNGRITARQSGYNTFETSLPGIGFRITVIFDKAGETRKEWILPFSTPLTQLPTAGIATEDIRLRFELVKTGIIQSGNLYFRLPALLSLNDNSLVVNMVLKILAAKAHCTIQLANPQLTLPPIKAQDLINNNNDSYPVKMNLQCMNTQRASISIEGVNDTKKLSVFKNVTTDNPAGGVGIEMLYHGNVIMPGRAINLVMPQQPNGFSLPLSVRYAKTEDKVSAGKVKAQITMHINYL